MATMCANCGGGMGGGSHVCGSCGFGTCGGCGAAMSPGLMTCGSCGWMAGGTTGFFGRRRQASITDDVGAYMADKSALDNLEDSGQGDSPMASMARAGMQAAQIKIIAGVAFGVVALIVILIIVSHMHSSPQALGALRASLSGGRLGPALHVVARSGA